MQVLSNGQKISFEFQGTNYLVTVLDVVTTGATSGSASPRGLLTKQTLFLLESAGGSLIKVRSVRGSLRVAGCCLCFPPVLHMREVSVVAAHGGSPMLCSKLRALGFTCHDGMPVDTCADPEPEGEHWEGICDVPAARLLF